MESKKRKRENDGVASVVTFFAPDGRVFDRVFRDEDLESMKKEIRKKLCVSKQTELKLVQLREGREVDLEDDDDFDALRVQAAVHHSLQVKVTFPEAQPAVAAADDLYEEDVDHSAKKKRVSFGETASILSRQEPASTLSKSPAKPTTPLKSALVHHSTPDSPSPEAPKTKPKKKKKKSRLSVVDEGGAISSSKELAAESSSAPEIFGKRERKEGSSHPSEEQVTVFTEAAVTPLSVKKKRKRGDKEHSPTPSKPPNVSVETNTSVPPKEPKAKKAKKAKKSVASEVDQTDSKLDTAAEKEAVKPLKRESKAAERQKASSLHAADEHDQSLATASLNGKNSSEKSKKSSKKKKSTGVPTSSASSTTPPPTILEPNAEGEGAKPTKRKPRREEVPQVPVNESTVDGGVPHAEGSSGSLRSSAEQQPNSTPRTNPPCSNHPANQRVSPVWSIHCPVCRRSGSHYHYACPIVLGDLDQLEQRVSEMREEGLDAPLMQVMEGFLSSARKKREAISSSTTISGTKDAPTAHEPSASQPSGSAENHETPSSTEDSRKLSVAANGQESSAESSDSETSGNEDEDEAKRPPSTAARSPMLPQEPSTAKVDSDGLLESLMRGPVRSSRSILADIPSDSDTGSDNDGMESEDPEKEDEENDKSFRRLAKRLQQGDSSDEEQVAGDDEGTVPTFMDVDSKEPPPQEPSASPSSSPEAQANESVARAQPNNVDSETPPPRPEMISPSLPQGTPKGSRPEDNTETPSQQLVEQTSTALPSGTSWGAGPAAQPNSTSHDPPTRARSEGNADKAITLRSGTSQDPQEDPADPIEPADDFVDDTEPVAQDEDPIEHDSDIRGFPPSNIPKLPIIKGMKDRIGQTTSQGARPPVLAAKAIQSTSPQVARPKRGKKKDENPPMSQPEKVNPPVPASNPAPTQKLSSAALMPPPPVVTSASEPKRRGRPPISREEKEKREAARQAEKAERAAERAAARAAAKAEKEAKKLAAQTEKAKSSRKGPVKPRKSSSANPEKVGQAHTPDPVEASSSLPVGPDSEQRAKPPHTTKSAPSLASQGSVRWTVLSQSQPQTPELESSVVDELRSSSPSISVDLPPHPAATPPRSQPRVNGKQAPPIPALIPLQPPASQLLLTPLKLSGPLFLPGTQSQFPDSSMEIHGQNSSQQSLSPSIPKRAKNGLPSSQHPPKPGAPMGSARYPRLTDLSSQVLFSPPTFSSTPVPHSMTGKSSNTARDNDDEVSESSSSDSSSDDDEDSDDPSSNHIPSSRKAGASITKKKRGYLSGIV